MARKSRFHKACERQFSTICSAADLVCQEVTEDETGWDRLVEFPPIGHVGPLESERGGKRAFVQIKSRIQKGTQTQISLSNARKMAQDWSPWFIVLFHKPNAGLPKIYAKHIWGDLQADILKRIRQAHDLGQELHRQRMTIRFDETDEHTNDLCSWLEHTIDVSGSDYARLKERLFEEAGYEEGYGTATFSVSTHDQEAIALAFLGLGELDVKNWRFVRQRFGIKARFPEQEIASGRLTITPGARDCLVRVRSKVSGDVVALQGKLANNGLGLLDPKLARARLQAEFLDIVFSTHNAFNLTVRTDLEISHRLSYWKQYARVLQWIHAGEAQFEMWLDGTRAFTSSILSKDGAVPEWVPQVEEIAEQLLKISTIDCDVTLRDLFENSLAIKGLTAISFAPSMKLQFPMADGPKGDFDQSLFYAAVKVGAHVFCSMVRRPVVHSFAEGLAERSLIFGPAELLDHYATTETPEARLALLHEEFMKLVETVGDRVIGVGNIEHLLHGRNIPITVGGRLA